MFVAVIGGVAVYFAPAKAEPTSSLQFAQMHTDKATTIRQEKTMGTTRGAWFVEMVAPVPQ